MTSACVDNIEGIIFDIDDTLIRIRPIMEKSITKVLGPLANDGLVINVNAFINAYIKVDDD